MQQLHRVWEIVLNGCIGNKLLPPSLIICIHYKWNKYVIKRSAYSVACSGELQLPGSCRCTLVLSFWILYFTLRPPCLVHLEHHCCYRKPLIVLGAAEKKSLNLYNVISIYYRLKSHWSILHTLFPNILIVCNINVYNIMCHKIKFVNENNIWYFSFVSLVVIVFLFLVFYCTLT